MIETTCCGLVSEDDAALVAHDYPAHNLPTWLVWACMWMTGVAMAVGILAGLTVAYDVIVNPQEDSGDILLNCYAYGDGDCGNNAPWHGFINL